MPRKLKRPPETKPPPPKDKPGETRQDVIDAWANFLLDAEDLGLLDAVEPEQQPALKIAPQTKEVKP
jgi:hypothetical protein